MSNRAPHPRVATIEPPEFTPNNVRYIHSDVIDDLRRDRQIEEDTARRQKFLDHRREQQKLSRLRRNKIVRRTFASAVGLFGIGLLANQAIKNNENYSDVQRLQQPAALVAEDLKDGSIDSARVVIVPLPHGEYANDYAATIATSTAVMEVSNILQAQQPNESGDLQNAVGALPADDVSLGNLPKAQAELLQDNGHVTAQGIAALEQDISTQAAEQLANQK
jgi:hypothetical protein